MHTDIMAALAPKADKPWTTRMMAEQKEEREKKKQATNQPKEQNTVK